MRQNGSIKIMLKLSHDDFEYNHFYMHMKNYWGSWFVHGITVNSGNIGLILTSISGT